MNLCVLFLLCLHLSSGAEITKMQLYTDHLYTKVGSRLMIPCVFSMDEAIHADDKIHLEWGMTPEGGSAYRPIIRSSETSLLSVKRPNLRAHVIPSHLQRRLCSLVIDPANREDRGTYELHLTINGVQYEPAPKIRIHVKDNNDVAEPSVTDDEQTNKEDLGYGGHSPNVVSLVDEATHPVPDTIQKVIEGRTEDITSPEAMWYIRTFWKIKNSHRLQYIVIAVAVILFLLLLGCISGCFCGAMCAWWKLKETDPLKAMEEGSLLENTKAQTKN